MSQGQPRRVEHVAGYQQSTLEDIIAVRDGNLQAIMAQTYDPNAGTIEAHLWDKVCGAVEWELDAADERVSGALDETHVIVSDLVSGKDGDAYRDAHRESYTPSGAQVIDRQASDPVVQAAMRAGFDSTVYRDANGESYVPSGAQTINRLASTPAVRAAMRAGFDSSVFIDATGESYLPSGVQAINKLASSLMVRAAMRAGFDAHVLSGALEESYLPSGVQAINKLASPSNIEGIHRHWNGRVALLAQKASSSHDALETLRATFGDSTELKKAAAAFWLPTEKAELEEAREALAVAEQRVQEFDERPLLGRIFVVRGKRFLRGELKGTQWRAEAQTSQVSRLNQILAS
jgi:hypothetical protein